jgi:hypothetical protein
MMCSMNIIIIVSRPPTTSISIRQESLDISEFNLRMINAMTIICVFCFINFTAVPAVLAS